jgi:hypothetical protein
VLEGLAFRQSDLRTSLCQIHAERVSVLDFRGPGTVPDLPRLAFRRDGNGSNTAGPSKAGLADSCAVDPGISWLHCISSIFKSLLPTLCRRTERDTRVSRATNLTRTGRSVICQPLLQHEKSLESYKLENTPRKWCWLRSTCFHAKTTNAVRCGESDTAPPTPDSHRYKLKERESRLRVVE